MANTEDTSASRRFLAAFQDVETYLRSRVEQGRHRPSFYELVDAEAERNAAVRHHHILLKEYADLRNAIVHERIGNDPIAEPHRQTVANLERIRDSILKPPRLLSRKEIAKRVVGCRPDDSVSVAARLMCDGDFSQVPVISDNDGLLGVLTSETIARWLGYAMGEDEIVLGASASDVLSHTEDPDHWRLLSSDASVFDAAELFDSYHARGRYLDAILISQRGKPKERLLGIVTIFDYPGLLR